MPSHSRSTRAGRLCSSIILTCALLFLSAAPPGCSSEKPLQTVPGPYQGPPLTIDDSGPQHIVIFTAPTSGWAAQLDLARRQLKQTDVFLTARRPNPAVVQIQATVEHRVATMVPVAEPLAVYIRILNAGEPAESQPYRASPAK